MTISGVAVAVIVTPRSIIAVVPCAVPDAAVKVVDRFVVRPGGVKFSEVTPLAFVVVITGVNVNPLAVQVTFVLANGTPIASKIVA